MEETITKPLSTKEYWDEVLRKAQLPRINSYRNYSYRVTMDFIHSLLKDAKGKSMLEIGCGSSGWLPYFRKRYELEISGLDYSEVGCEVAEENLRMQKLDFQAIYCKDFLDSNFSLNRKFDFIFSYGVVEHFENTAEILAIFNKLLNPGGKLITLVPNLKGLNGYVTRKSMPEIYALHKVMTNKELRKFHMDAGLSIVRSSYVGTFSVAVLPFANSNGWFFKQGTKRRERALTFIGYLDTVFSTFFKITRINLPGKFLSPYIICIAGNETDTKG